MRGEAVTVTAIVSAYCSERFMQGRIQNLLDQTLYTKKRLEIIVIDAASPENEEGIVRDFMREYDHIRYLKTEKRETVYAAWNRGIRLSSGSFVINANSDDRFAPDALEKLADALHAKPGTDAVYGDWEVTEVENDTFNSPSRKFTFTYPDFYPPLLFYYQISSHAAMIRKSVFDRIGFFQDDLRVFGDREFMFRFAAAGMKASKVDLLTGLYLERADSLERSEPASEKEFNAVRERYLMPENLSRLFGYEVPPGQKELSVHYASLGSSGLRFLTWKGNHISDLPFAAKAFMMALRLDPENIEALNNLGVLRCLNSQHEEGLKLLQRAEKRGAYEPIRLNIAAAQRGFLDIDRYLWMSGNECSTAGRMVPSRHCLTGGRDNNGDSASPMVSVIIPTCNRPGLLAEAVESVRRQSFQNYEVIIVNDGGGDISCALAAFSGDSRIRVINGGGRRGPAAARNRGLEEARAKYIAYLDDDDLYYDNHLETLVNQLETSGGAVAYSDAYEAIQTDKGGHMVTTDRSLVYSEDFDRDRLLVMNYIPMLTVMHRKDCIYETGSFDEDLKTHEDWDLWIRMSRRYDFHHLKTVTSEFRSRNGSTDSLSSRREDFLKSMIILHGRYGNLAGGPDVRRQQQYVQEELLREITGRDGQGVSTAEAELVVTKKGNFSLRVTGEDGSRKTLHSTYDPEGEARTAAEAFSYDGRGILVVLGLGLGYHAAALRKKYPETEIVVVEALQEIAEYAQEHGPRLDPGIKIIAGLNSRDALRKLTELQISRGMAPLCLFAMAPVLSAFPSYYRPLAQALRGSASVNLREKLRYKKFREERLTALLIDSGYFLFKEAEKALRSMGHRVITVPVRRNEGSASSPNAFMEAIAAHRPDFVLTVNHLGFDEEGVLASLLSSLEVPVASWFVDNPNLIVKAHRKNVTPWTSLFLWDRSYCKDMEALGFESVHFLPLATDAGVFKPLTARKHRRRIAPFHCEAGFVGNSMTGAVREFMEKVPADLHGTVERLAQESAFPHDRMTAMKTTLTGEEKGRIDGLTDKERMDLEAAVTWKATLLYRLDLIKALERFDTVIHGDEGWRTILERSSIRISQPLHYYRELPFFYNACQINFNATSRQMPETVNQRVFDVPACGAFILTDQQEVLQELFHVGREIITYRHRDEIPEIARFYLRYPSEREQVAIRGRERILKEHTYRHRLISLIHAMKRRYGK